MSAARLLDWLGELAAGNELPQAATDFAAQMPPATRSRLDSLAGYLLAP